jgi:hypothetical protein
MQDTEPGEALSTELNRLSEIAARDSKIKFTSLAHLLTEEFLKGCYGELNHRAAAGIDQVSYESYGEELDRNIADLVKRLRENRYRANDIRFTHYMTCSRRCGARLGRKTIGKRYRSTLIAMNGKLRKLRNLLSFRELHVHLGRVLKGYYNYYGFAGNAATLNKFAYAVERMWFKWLNRRSQRKSFNWEEFQERLKRFFLTKTQDSERLLLDLCRRHVNLPEEPDAGNPQVRFCEGPGPTDTWLK